MKKGNIITEKSFYFAIKTVNLYKFLIKTHKEYVLSRQLLRTGTSIGANISKVRNEAAELLKIIRSIILTTKQNQIHN